MVSTRAKVKQEIDDGVQQIDKVHAATNSRNGDIRQFFRAETKTTSITTAAGTDVTMEDQLTVISGDQISISSTYINVKSSTESMVSREVHHQNVESLLPMAKTGTSIPAISEEGVETNRTTAQDKVQKATKAKSRPKSVITAKATVQKRSVKATKTKAAVTQQDAISIEKTAVSVRGSKRRSSSDEGKLFIPLRPYRL